MFKLLLLCGLFAKYFSLKVIPIPFIAVNNARSLSKEKLSEKLVEEKTPLLLKNTFQIDDELFLDELVKKLSGKIIEYDSRVTDTGDIERYEATLSEFLSIVDSESDHDESLYLINEDIVNEDDFVQKRLKLPEDLFEKNLFDEFPSIIRPKLALVVGGVGARSFLHRDPFDWIGWNHLLEGKKLWLFLRPDAHELEEDLSARRHEVDAWSMDKYPLAAGYISDIDMFLIKYELNLKLLATALKTQTSSKNTKTSQPITKEIFSPIVQSLIDTYNHLSINNREKELLSRFKELPIFASGEETLDEYCEDFDSDGLWHDKFYIAIQEPGETIFIPPGCWHQVYHLEPSIAIAGQHMNTDIKEIVIDHILDYCSSNASEESLNEATSDDDVIDDYDAIENTSKLIEVALKRRFGAKLGKMKWNEIFSNK